MIEIVDTVEGRADASSCITWLELGVKDKEEFLALEHEIQQERLWMGDRKRLMRQQNRGNDDE